MRHHRFAVTRHERQKIFYHQSRRNRIHRHKLGHVLRRNLFEGFFRLNVSGGIMQQTCGVDDEMIGGTGFQFFR